MHRLVLLSLFVAPLAHAEVAVSVNHPLRWAGAGAVAASGYFGITEHHAIRANLAHYEYGPNSAGEAIGFLAFGATSEAMYDGSVTDAGIGWMISPRRLCDGFSLELGVLVRRRSDAAVEDSYARDFRVETDTTTVAGRALIGWSWRFYDLFVAAQVGISGGYERGKETVLEDEFDRMNVTRDVARQDISAEGFLRFGAVFR